MVAYGGGSQAVFGDHLLKVLDPSDLSPVAARMEEEVQTYVAALVSKPNRLAVLDRPIIGDFWPIPLGFRTYRSIGFADDEGRSVVMTEAGMQYADESPEEADASECPALSTADNLAYYPDGRTEPMQDYFDRTFYTPENTGKNWHEMLPDLNGTTDDWVGVALYRLWHVAMQDQESPVPSWPYWPSDVSAADLATALERVKDKDATDLARVLRKGKTVRVVHALPPESIRNYEPTAWHRELTPEGNGAVEIKLDLSDASQALEKWNLTLCSLVVSAEKQVEADRRIPTVRMSARPHARAAFRMLAEGPPTIGGVTNWVEGRTGLTQKGNFELVWEGRRHPYQLNLLNDEPLSAGLVKAIQAELQDDGVRDWLTFHVMAEEQGGTGDFRWSWREHRERAGYDRRVASKSTRDAEVAAACVARIGRFTRAEARLEQERGGRKFWVRIGDHGLLDVPAGIDELTESGWLTTVAAVRLNKGILAGARGRERAPYYALIHRDIIALPRIERTLGTLLAFDWRVARDNGGTVVRTARTLWDYARIQGGQWEKRKRWPEARRSLDRALDVLGERIGLDWHVEAAGAHGLDGPDARYIIEPPPWWRDRLLHGVSPVLGQNTAGVPRTGAELAEWRSEHGVSLRQAAAIVGVKSPETIRKAETKANATLPADWLPLLAKARHG